MANEAIFIGYRRDDTADVAGRIFDALEARFGRERLFKDVDNLRPGSDFGEHIKGMLPRCRVALILIGPRWLEAKDKHGRRRLDDPNDWVRQETEIALSAAKLQVVPVLINGAPMPRKEELPASLHPLLQRHAATIRRDPDFRYDIDRLAKELVSSVRGDDVYSGAADRRSISSDLERTLLNIPVWEYTRVEPPKKSEVWREITQLPIELELDDVCAIHPDGAGVSALTESKYGLRAHYLHPSEKFAPISDHLTRQNPRIITTAPGEAFVANSAGVYNVEFERSGPIQAVRRFQEFFFGPKPAKNVHRLIDGGCTLAPITGRYGVGNVLAIPLHSGSLNWITADRGNRKSVKQGDGSPCNGDHAEWDKRHDRCLVQQLQQFRMPPNPFIITIEKRRKRGESTLSVTAIDAPQFERFASHPSGIILAARMQGAHLHLAFMSKRGDAILHETRIACEIAPHRMSCARNGRLILVRDKLQKAICVLDILENRQLYSMNKVRFASLSPDGQRIAVVQERDVSLVAARTGELLQKLENVDCHAWSHDAASIFAAKRGLKTAYICRLKLS